MEKSNPAFSRTQQRVLHPSFYQCAPVFLVPFILFLFLPFGVGLYPVLFLFWVMEAGFLFFVWAFIATTFYVIQPDRVEMRRGILVRREKTILFSQITEISVKQTLPQRIFGIGDLFIETAGDKSQEGVLAGVEGPEAMGRWLLSLRRGGQP